MRQVGAFEGKNNFGRLLDMAEAGEEVVITRHGRPVARIVPISGASNEHRERARAAAERIRNRAKVRGTHSFAWSEWKEMRDEGRR